MNCKPEPVPDLDLSPKLNCPLSLFNPLDYIRLLYWIFFFPQALRWYVQDFEIELAINENKNHQKRSKSSQKSRIKFLLFLQGLLLTFATPFLVCLTLYVIGFYIHWSLMLVGIVISVVLGLFVGVVLSIENSVVISVGFGVLFGVGFGISFGAGNVIIVGGVWGMFTGGVLISILMSLPLNGKNDGMVEDIARGMAWNVVSGIVIVLLSIVASARSETEWSGVTFSIVGVLAGLLCSLTSLRPEVWLISLLTNWFSLQNSSFLFPRVTAIPLPQLRYRLATWLQQDWQAGLKNINEVLKYSLQFIPVIKAVNLVLDETSPEHLITKISQLSDNPYDWNLVKFASASVSQEFNSQLIAGLSLGRKPRLEVEPRLDTPVHATAAGFWYLHEKQPEKAVQAFAVVSSLPYGEEMLTLAKILMIFNQTRNFDEITNVNLPNFIKKTYLRSKTWDIIKTFYQTLDEIKVIKNSVSPSIRSLAVNRALNKAETIKRKSRLLPKPENALIYDIAEIWHQALLLMAAEVGNVSITQKLKNPYIIGDPVIGKQFVGRKDIINRLEELWVSTPQLQSVVLFGHRRMGKTSILRNISTRLDEKVKLAYVNLLTVGNSIQGVGEVLMAIADSISDTLQIPPPDDESLINLPYRTFERYLKQIETHLGDTGLIIALDEFEQIEELIKSDRIPKDFMGVLRGMVQMSPKIAFALAGLHTLEEMTEDYFNPFFASIIPIRVSFLERATCRYLLANPGEDFPLDYKLDALDYIYDLTAGQPYLVQLIGFLLVRRYNDQVFELGNKRDPMFAIADVNGIINQPEFYQNGRYYFTGVWQQAGEGSSGQQSIIKAIAPHPTGLDFNTLKTVTNLDPNSLQNALDTLSRHDVITETDNHWRVIVELFRRWVINN